jgi:hypothetical protein
VSVTSKKGDGLVFDFDQYPKSDKILPPKQEDLEQDFAELSWCYANALKNSASHVLPLRQSKGGVLDHILQALVDPSFLYEESKTMKDELAKWGAGVLSFWLRATQDCSDLHHSSVPDLPKALLGEIQNNVPLGEQSLSLTRIRRLQDLLGYRQFHFDNTSISHDTSVAPMGIEAAGIEWYLKWKHPSDDRKRHYVEYITKDAVYKHFCEAFVSSVMPVVVDYIDSQTEYIHDSHPMCRRSQVQLAHALLAGDTSVWVCRMCDPPSYHSMNLDYKGRKHTCRTSGNRSAPVHPSVPHLSQAVSPVLGLQPERVQRNYLFYKELTICQAMEAAVVDFWKGVCKDAMCRSCVFDQGLVCARPGSDVNSQIRQFGRIISGYCDFRPAHYQRHIAPPPKPSWIKFHDHLWVTDRHSKPWSHCPICGEHSANVKTLVGIEQKEKILAHSSRGISAEEENNKAKILSDLDKHKLHFAAKIAQPDFYHKDVDKIVSDRSSAVVIMDFSQFTIGGGKTAKVNNLIAVVLSSDADTAGRLHRHYIDTVANAKDEDDKNDFFFFRAWLDQFLETVIRPLGITRLHLWSDGGRKHFKQKHALAEFSLVLVKHTWLKFASWNFFPSYHGKGLCDSHAGKIAQAVAYAAFHDNFIWTTSRDLIGLIKKRLSNSTPMVLSSVIDRSEHLKHDVLGMANLYQYHYFEATNTVGQLLVAKLKRDKLSRFTFKKPHTRNKTDWKPAAAPRTSTQAKPSKKRKAAAKSSTRTTRGKRQK